MNIYRKLLRLGIAVSSFIGFLIGWVFLAHTPDPDTVIVADTDITIERLDLPSIPSVNGLSNNSGTNNVQIFSVNPSTSQSQPSFSSGLRTGGS